MPHRNLSLPFFLLLVIYSFSPTLAQAPDSAAFDLGSPRQTTRSFRFYSRPENYDYNLAIRCFDLDPKKDTMDIVRKLNQIVDGAGIFVKMEEISDSLDYEDPVTQLARYTFSDQYSGIYLERIGNKWVFPKSSIRSILEIHQEIFILGTGTLLDIFGQRGDKRYFGLSINQYLGVLLVIFIAYLFHKILVFVLDKVFIRILHKVGWSRIADKGIRPVIAPASSFFVILLLSFFIRILQLPSNISHYLVIILQALLPLMATVVFYRLVNPMTVYLERLAEKTESTLDDQLIPIVRKTLRTFVVLIGTLVTLESLNVPILPLLTGLSIGGLAFALAAQDTIKNFFGSLMIFVDKPFQIGHWITSGSDIDGTVEEVGFRSTRIRTFGDSVIYVPNGKLADAVIDNHGLRSYRRFTTKIGLTYDTPSDKIEAFVKGLEDIVLNHPHTRKDYHHVYFNEMGPFSLNILFYIFFEVPDWAMELRARHEVLLEIVNLAKKVGVEFAFPTQTLHVEGVPNSG